MGKLKINLEVSKPYKITEPLYDDYEEGLKPETDIVEVIKKYEYGVVFKNIEHNFTYERTFDYLSNCKIEEY